MGPGDPWSPNWRPDTTGQRRVAIRAARRGGLSAGVLYLPLAAAALATGPWQDELELLVLVIGLPGVALLGAGLAPAALGSRVDAAVAGIAFAVGAPVAAVTSAVIGAFLLGAFASGGLDLAGPVLRAGVGTAVSLAPVVAAVAALWVVVVRRVSRPAEPAPGAPAPDPTSEIDVGPPEP